MSKTRDVRKELKKAPVLNPKEKREAKRLKQSERHKRYAIDPLDMI